MQRNFAISETTFSNMRCHTYLISCRWSGFDSMGRRDPREEAHRSSSRSGDGTLMAVLQRERRGSVPGGEGFERSGEWPPAGEGPGKVGPSKVEAGVE
jgi:hypothetical protein